MRDISLSLSMTGGFNAPSAKAFIQFCESLNDEKPAMFVEKALPYVLRTEPPVYVTMDGLHKLIDAWAEDQSARTGKSVSELFLAATRKIIEAYRSNVIKDFDPKVFYRPFVEGLVSRCPEAERATLEEGLRVLKAQIAQRWEKTGELEFAR